MVKQQNFPGTSESEGSVLSQNMQSAEKNKNRTPMIVLGTFWKKNKGKFDDSVGIRWK